MYQSQGLYIGGWKVVTSRSTLASLELYGHDMAIDPLCTSAIFVKAIDLKLFGGLQNS